MTIKIKKASLKDLEAIYCLNVVLAKYELKFDPVRKKPREKRGFRRGQEELRKKLKKKDCQFLIAEDKRKPVGFIEGCIKKSPSIYKYPRKGEIGPTFVKREYRNKDIGKKLVKGMLNWFKSRKVKWAQITTHAKNINAITFWKKMGFKEYSIRMNLLLK